MIVLQAGRSGVEPPRVRIRGGKGCAAASAVTAFTANLLPTLSELHSLGQPGAAVPTCCASTLRLPQSHPPPVPRPPQIAHRASG